MTTTSQGQKRPEHTPLSSGKRSNADKWFRRTLALAGASLLFFLATMFISTAIDAWPVFQHSGWGFITSSTWDVGTSRSEITGEYGTLAFIVGTLLTSGIALLIAVPLSIGTALYLSHVASGRVRKPLSYAIELLAAVPSIVYGLWGLLFFVPVFLRPAMDFIAATVGQFIPFLGPPVVTYNYFAAGVVLSIMILPIITAVTREVMSRTPESEIAAAYALGSTRWEMLRFVVLHRSRPGIIGAIMLGLGRALGETIAVAMLIGGSKLIGQTIFLGGESMAGIIAETFQEAAPENVKALIGVGVVLFIITIIVNMIARGIVWATGGRVMGDASV
ncbi:MAG TPA: phosphate ABC transporter permease subunit PstC [Acidimicrobiia bacterium]|nr:phosphate ABC transporter permease subunit PstC [Acidimicrobiia bacterium]